MPIYAKRVKNLLQNQESFEAESWCIASRTQGLQSFFFFFFFYPNDDHRLTFDHFTARSNLRPMEKMLKSHFLKLYLRLIAET